MHLVDDEVFVPVRHRAQRTVFVRPELLLARPLRRRKIFVVEMFRHRLRIDDDGAALGPVQILPRAVPGGLAFPRVFGFPVPAPDLAARVEVGAIGDAAVILRYAKHVELVVPTGEIPERGIGGIARPDAVVALGKRERVLHPAAIVPDVAGDRLADDGVGRACVRRPDGKAQHRSFRALAPQLVGAQPPAMGEPVAFDLPIAAEGETAVLNARVGIGGLGRNAPHVALLRSVHQHAPVERPSALRIVEQNIGAPGGAPVGGGKLLHGGRTPLAGVTTIAVPAAHQTHIAEDRSPQPGEPFEPHPELRHGPPPRVPPRHCVFIRALLQ